MPRILVESNLFSIPSKFGILAIFWQTFVMRAIKSVYDVRFEFITHTRGGERDRGRALILRVSVVCIVRLQIVDVTSDFELILIP